MALAATVLTEITTIANTPTVYVTRTTFNSYVQQIALHNPSLTGVTIKIYKVPNNAGAIGVASSVNVWYTEIVVAGNTSFITLDKPGIILANTNDTIQLEASTTNVVTLQIYGFTEI